MDKEKEQALLDELQAINPVAAARYVLLRELGHYCFTEAEKALNKGQFDRVTAFMDMSSEITKKLSQQ